MSEVAIVFNGPINHPASTKLRNSICHAANGGFNGQQGLRCTKLWLLMTSSGGGIEDGFGMYHLLRSINAEVVTVNMGLVTSIANVIFLAGTHRIATPHSFFQFHDFDWNFAGAHSMDQHNLAYSTQQLATSKIHKKSLLKQHTNLTDADFDTLKLLEQSTVIDATAAKGYGIVHDVMIPPIPPGVTIFNSDY